MRIKKSGSISQNRRKRTRASKSSKISQQQSSSLSSSIVKRGELSDCPRCKQEDSVELTCDKEIFFCSNCAWSFNLRIFSTIVAADMMKSLLKGFKQVVKRWKEAVEKVGETFESFGEIVRRIDEKIKEEERKKELAEMEFKK